MAQRSKKRLTAAQLEELERLAKAPQPTFGTHRARVQNNLVLLRLAVFTLDGRKLDGVCGPTGLRHCTDACEITHDGMVVLKQNGFYPADPSLRASVRTPYAPILVRESTATGDIEPMGFGGGRRGE